MEISPSLKELIAGRLHVALSPIHLVGFLLADQQIWGSRIIPSNQKVFIQIGDEEGALPLQK
jgi:hypothetical protein